MFNKINPALYIILIFVMFLVINNISTVHAQEIELGRIDIPAISVSAPILNAPIANNTWDVSHLSMTTAHLQDLPWFGMSSNVVIAGHSIDVNGNPDIFYNLNKLQSGDEIVVNANGQVYRYIGITADNNYLIMALFPLSSDRVAPNSEMLDTLISTLSVTSPNYASHTTQTNGLFEYENVHFEYDKNLCHKF